MSVTADLEASTTEGVSQLTALAPLFTLADGSGSTSTETSDPFQDLFYEFLFGGAAATPKFFFVMRGG